MFRSLFFVFILSFQLNALASSFEKFSDLLVGKDPNEVEYNKIIESYSNNFKLRFVNPITAFTESNLHIGKKSLFYPFAGPDISYPLLFFPNLEQYVLVGLEFPGSPEFINHKFNLAGFKPQVEGYLRSGFFKTMNMSAQMHYNQGVIPMLVAQIALLNGKVENITSISEPYKGVMVEFSHNQMNKKLYYFRANLNDYNDKTKFYEFIQKNNLIENCMLKASSYKLHQVEFKQLSKYMLDNCQLILQDDTGMPVKALQHKGNDIELYGDYIKPYGDEFRPYYQKTLAELYKTKANKIPLNFCFGYGCDRVESNILISKIKGYSALSNPSVDLLEPEIEAN